MHAGKNKTAGVNSFFSDLVDITCVQWRRIDGTRQYQREVVP